jgi:hypothetical protein
VDCLDSRQQEEATVSTIVQSPPATATCGHDPEVLDARTGMLVQAIVDGPCAECFLRDDDRQRRRADR